MVCVYNSNSYFIILMNSYILQLIQSRDSSPSSSETGDAVEANVCPSNVDSSATNFARITVNHPLHQSEPARMDILLGRGRGHMHHPGNIYFRQIVEKHAPVYNNPDSKQSKTQIANHVATKVLRKGVFRKFDTKSNSWIKISDDQAREKIGHALRYKFRRTKGKSPAKGSNALKKPPDPGVASMPLSSKDSDDEFTSFPLNSQLFGSMGYDTNLPTPLSHAKTANSERWIQQPVGASAQEMILTDAIKSSFSLPTINLPNQSSIQHDNQLFDTSGFAYSQAAPKADDDDVDSFDKAVEEVLDTP
jgi:hypothetical protein